MNASDGAGSGAPSGEAPAGGEPERTGEPGRGGDVSSRGERIARAEVFLKNRDFRALGDLLGRLYAEQIPPRGTTSAEDPVVRLLRRFSAVFTSFALTIPLWACLAVPGFARWSWYWPAWVWLAAMLLPSYYLSALAGYSFWRPGQGPYAWLYLALVAANALHGGRNPQPTVPLFVLAHLGGAFALLIVLRTGAANLARAGLGAKLAYLATAALGYYGLLRAYGASPWILPLVGLTALITGPVWSRLFPEPGRPAT